MTSCGCFAMDKTKVMSTLGLAMRAQKLISGEEFSTELIQKGRACLVFLASDAGKNTTKKITDKAGSHNIRVISNLTGAEISRAIGKKNRKVVTIIDKNFADLLEQSCKE